jgi:hypothetical protein
MSGDWADNWKERALKAEEKLRLIVEQVINPPMMIMNVDFEERWGKATKELEKFQHLWGNLYWRVK